MAVESMTVSPMRFDGLAHEIAEGNRARHIRDDLIRDLRAEGETLAYIAELTGLTAQRVHQICNR